jgi:hypothetical protein
MKKLIAIKQAKEKLDPHYLKLLIHDIHRNGRNYTDGIDENSFYTLFKVDPYQALQALKKHVLDKTAHLTTQLNKEGRTLEDFKKQAHELKEVYLFFLENNTVTIDSDLSEHSHIMRTLFLSEAVVTLPLFNAGTNHWEDIFYKDKLLPLKAEIESKIQSSTLKATLTDALEHATNSVWLDPQFIQNKMSARLQSNELDLFITGTTFAELTRNGSRSRLIGEQEQKTETLILLKDYITHVITHLKAKKASQNLDTAHVELLTTLIKGVYYLTLRIK